MDPSPNTKISPEAFALVEKEFSKELKLKEESRKIILKVKDVVQDAAHVTPEPVSSVEPEPQPKPVKTPVSKQEPVAKPADSGPVVLGKIDLSQFEKSPKTKKSSEEQTEAIVKPIEESKIAAKAERQPQTTNQKQQVNRLRKLQKKIKPAAVTRNKTGET